MSQKKMAIIASRGTLDWGYPPFILASTAAALGFDVKMFFTFYGMQLLKKDLDLKFSALGNPAVPMPFPMPNIVQTLPGMQELMTSLFKKQIRAKGVADIGELRDLCVEAGVDLVACQMSVDLFDFRREQMIEGVEIGGAATFLEFAATADIQLFL